MSKNFMRIRPNVVSEIEPLYFYIYPLLLYKITLWDAVALESRGCRKGKRLEQHHYKPPLFIRVLLHTAVWQNEFGRRVLDS